MAEAALNLRVLDLTHLIAGPYCTRLLAGLGAEVIKIERPGIGDKARHIGPFPDDRPHPERSGLFLYLNRNKKGITLNLKTATGGHLFQELIRSADIVVENFAPRVMPSLGLDYPTLEKINPRLVMTSISNFGQEGPYRDYKATDLVAYALGGLMYITGAYDREPLKHGLSQAQYLAGSLAATATLGAVLSQKSENQGQHVDVSLQESVLLGMFIQLTTYAYTGAVSRRQPKESSVFANVVPAKDGYSAPVFYGFVDWKALAQLVDCPEVADGRYASYAGINIQSPELEKLLVPHFAQRGKHELFHAAQALRLPFGVAQTAADLISCPQLKERDFFSEITHPEVGTLKYPGAPFKMSESPWRESSPAPLLGQHNEEIYCGLLGYSRTDLVRLRQGGII